MALLEHKVSKYTAKVSSTPSYIEAITFDHWLVVTIGIPSHVISAGDPIEARSFLFDRIENELTHSFSQELKFFGSPNP